MKAIRDRRGGELLKLDRMLLHSPPVAEGWNLFMGNMRTELDLPYRLRELVMCVVAVLNSASYEYEHHAWRYVDAGASQEQADLLQQLREPSFPLDMYPELEQDVITLGREMTVNVDVSRPLKQKLLRQLGTRQTVELIGMVSAYNMVSRFLVACDIDTEHGDE